MLFFLDDDAFLPDARGSWPTDAACWPQRPELGLIQPRVVDPTGRVSPRRWIPRIRKGDPAHSSNVFSCWEGAVLMPRAVFDATGGWADPFFYAHEGIELAWRVWDTGHVAWYAGDLEAGHPVIDPARHAYYYRLNARNRVWLARRNLPACSSRSTWARGPPSRCCAGRATRRRCGRGSAAGGRDGASIRGSGARCAGARCGA